MAKNEKMSAVLDLRGLDMVTPVDLISNGHTPYAQNFRLYAQQSDSRRVAVSSRKGSGFYTSPLAEVLSDSVQATVGASTAEVGIVTGIQGIRLTAPNNDLITRFDIMPSDTNQATGPLLIEIWSDKDGLPANLLSTSSILSGDIGTTAAWKTARFINAVRMVSGQHYWFIIRMQDDGKNTYSVATTTSGTHAYATSAGLAQLTQQNYTINYKLYTTPALTDKGAYRFNRDNGANITVVAFNDSVYRIDEASNSFVKIVDGMNVLAEEYRFTNADNKVFWVNGFNNLRAWDGTDEASAASKVTNGGFDTVTTNWSAISGTTLARSTAEFHTAPASGSATAASGIRGLSYAVTLEANKRYKVTYWAKGATATGNTFMTVNGLTTAITGSTNNLTTGWTKYEMYYTPGLAVTTLDFKSSSDNFFIDDVSVIDTGVETILDPDLPILSDIVMHKDRMWGRVAADPNKMVYSENPGNPAYDPTGVTPTTAKQQWYYAWLSVSFWYVPRPHNGSPITSLTSFQDALTITTADNKYTLSGADRGSFYLRQATGNKGALSRRGVTSDENNIVLVADDGFYLNNGSSDKKISAPISPLFDACGQKDKITPVIWKNQIRFYMASQGSPVNDICAIYDKDLDEWMLDTNVYADRALYYNDSDDDHQLMEMSSVAPIAYLAEQDYNSLGAPIDFEYRFKYDSMGTPMQKKRLKRFFPILQGVDSSYTIQLAMDKDFQDSPAIKEQLLVTNGAKLGQFKLGDGTKLGGDKSFKPIRQSYSGYAYYWQLRVIRKAVNNRVALIGAQYSYKTKRL